MYQGERLYYNSAAAGLDINEHDVIGSFSWLTPVHPAEGPARAGT